MIIRNGPFPWANSGLMYAGTNPGNANARAKPPSRASSLIEFPVVEHLGAGVHEADHGGHVPGHRQPACALMSRNRSLRVNDLQALE